MKILLVHNFYKQPGGEDTVFKNEKKLLEENGHKVVTYTRDNNELSLLDLLNADFSFRTYRDIRNILSVGGFDLVHVHNTQFLISPAVFKAARDEGVKAVWTLHNFRLVCASALLYRKCRTCEACIKDIDGKGPDYGRALRGRCYRDSFIYTAILVNIHEQALKAGLFKDLSMICLTDFNKQKLIEGGFCAGKIFIKPNFTWRSAFKGTEKIIPRTFIYVGRIEEIKGIWDILREWKKLPLGYELICCGDGEIDPSMRLPNVKFLGQVEKDKVLRLMSRAQALIFASRVYECFPMTIIESFSVGTPVLGTKQGNGGTLLRRIYGHGRSESSAEKLIMKDITELSDRVLSFRREDYSFDKKALEDYYPEKNYEKLMSIYREIQGNL